MDQTNPPSFPPQPPPGYGRPPPPQWHGWSPPPQSPRDAIDAGGFEHADVLAEIDRQQNKKSGGWLSGVLILIVSMAVFVGLGAWHWSWGLALALVPILLFHELGHYVTMRIFRYRNLRMFFIPFLGAAVSGRNYNVPGWKKGIVFLMGPVPGIVVGTVIGFVGLFLKHETLILAALLTIALNALNLIPVLPFDGGWVAHVLLFSRHWLADVIFRTATAGLLLLIGILGGERLLAILGVLMLLGVPLSLRIARIVRDLRRAGFAPVSPDDQSIPLHAAQVIVAKLREAMPRGIGTKTLAQQTLQVFEALNARPPGVAASFGLAAVHAGSFVLALIMSFALIFLGRPDFLRNALAARDDRAPQMVLSEDSIRSWRFDALEADAPPVQHVTIVATFPKSRALTDISSFAPNARRFGQTLLIPVPPDDDATRQNLIAQLQSGGAVVFVDSEVMRATVRLSGAASDEDAAKRIEGELDAYLRTASMHTIPPWQTPDSRTPDAREAHLRARQLYVRLEDRYPPDPAERIKASVSRQTEVEFVERYIDITNEREVVYETSETSTRPTYDSQVEHQRLIRELGPMLGQLPLQKDKPIPGFDRFSAWGIARRNGSRLTIDYLRFEDLFEGPPALTKWLADQGVKDLRSEIKADPSSGLDDESD